MKIQLSHTFEDIVSLENLFCAWREFLRGKRRRNDVRQFERDLADSIVTLHEDLIGGTYRHGSYEAFYVHDPKRRHIHKASVRDRLLHHAVHRCLYPSFDKILVSDVFSSRRKKGIHKAIDRFREYAYKVSRNNTRTCWILQGDIRTFFASVDHTILSNGLCSQIPDVRLLELLQGIIQSFHTDGQMGKGVPLGNLTSQLFVNVYLNPFDQWMKHRMKEQHYIRYADDFVVLSSDRRRLEWFMFEVAAFLETYLRLNLHPNKTKIKTLASGVDFLGWVHFPDHRVLRTTTKRRMLKKVRLGACEETLASYRGLLKHGNAHKLQCQLEMYS